MSNIIFIDSTNVGWFLKWGTYNCWLSTWIYMHLSFGFQDFQIINFGMQPQFFFKIKELVRKPLIICGFFHENYWPFEVFQIIEINTSLILKAFQIIKTKNLLILEFFINWSQQFVNFVKNHPSLVATYNELGEGEVKQP